MQIAAYLGIAAFRCVFTADPSLYLILIRKNKQNVIGDFTVDLAQNSFIQFWFGQTQLENLDLCHPLSGSEIQGGHCQLVAPVDTAQLVCKQSLDCRWNGSVFIELLFRNPFVKLRGGWKAQH